MNDPQIQSNITGPAAAQGEFRAFISYRRKDAGRIAGWLRRRLISYKPPKSLLKLLTAEEREALAERRSYFLDSEYAKANEDFWSSNIEPALQKSKYLIVISSPAAFERRDDGSENWVAREIERFHAIHRNPGRITLALAPGAVEDRFPGHLAALSERWDWADFRGYTWGLWRWLNLPRAFKLDDEFLKIVAGIFDIPSRLLPILRQEEARRRLRIVCAVAGILLLTVGAFAGLAILAEINRREAVVQRVIAEKQRQEAVNQRLIAEQQRQQAVAQQLRLIASRAIQIFENDPMSGLALALEVVGGAERVPDLPEVVRSLVQPLHENFEVALIAHEPHFISTVDEAKYDSRMIISAGFDVTGGRIATMAHDGSARMWDAKTGRALPGFGRAPWYDGDSDKEYRSGELAFSRTRLATAFQQNPIDLWDTRNGSHIASLDVQRVPIERLAFSAKMQTLVVLISDGRVMMFDQNDGALKAKIATGATLNEPCRGSTFAADATILAICAGPNAVVVWDLERRAPLRTIRYPGVAALALSSNGKMLATGDQNGRVFIWDVATGKRVSTAIFDRPRNADNLHIDQLMFSPSASQLLVVSNGAAMLYDTESGTLSESLEDDSVATTFGQGMIYRKFAYSPDGRSLAEARPDGIVRHWALSANSRQANLRRLKGHLNRVWETEFSPDGNFILSVSVDGTVRVWNPYVPEPLQTPILVSSGGSPWSGDATPLVFARRDGFAEFFEWRSGRMLAGSEMNSEKTAAARYVKEPSFLSDDGRMLAVFDNANNLRIWRTTDRHELATISIGGEEPARVLIDPTGRWAAIRTDQCNVYIAPTARTGAATVRRPPKSSDNSELPICAIGIAAASGKLMAAFSLAQHGQKLSQVHLVDLETGAEIGVLEGDPDPIRSIWINPDGTWLAGLGDSGTITIWDVRERKVLRQLEDKEQHALVSWGPNGLIAVARLFGSTSVWEVSTGQQIAVLSGPLFGSYDVAFSSDGRVVIDGRDGSKGSGGPIILWDLKSGQPLQQFMGSTPHSYGVAISRDGARIIAHAADQAFIGRPIVHVEEAKAEALKRLSRCLTPEQRAALFLPHDPPVWCRGKWPYLAQ